MISPKFLFMPLLTLVLIYSTTLVIASDQEATPGSDIDPEIVKENIKKRIDQAVSNNSTDLLTTQKSPIKGWVGTIESLTSDSLTLSSSDENRIVSISSTTSIVKTSATLSRTNVELEDLAIEDFLIAMGRIDDQGVLEAIRLAAFETQPAPITTQVALGQITQIDEQPTSITLTPLNQDSPLTLTLSSDTNLLSSVPEETLEVEDLSPADQVLVIYQPDQKDSDTLNLLTLKRLSTPTPEPEASPTPTTDQ